MATQERTVYVCDVTGNEIPSNKVCTRMLQYGGTEMELHLAPKEAKKFDKDFEAWINLARRVKGKQSRPKKAKAVTPSASALKNTEIRDWANSKGYELKARGRIPNSVIDAYNKAH